jgi:hypothetical protein
MSKLSKEAELFEKANIVDIGIQPNEFSPHGIHQAMESLSVDDGNCGESALRENSDEGLETLNIDEVEAVDHAVEEGLVDNNLIVDEDYRNSLRERANQFMAHDGNSVNTNSFPAVPKPKVDYTFSDEISVRRELDEWFSSNEIELLPSYYYAFRATYGDVTFNGMSVDEKESMTEKLIDGLNSKTYHSALQQLTYISLGSFEQNKLMFEEQVHNIKRNTLFLVRYGVVQRIVPLLKSTFTLSSTIRFGLSLVSKSLFNCCTILYVTLLVYLDNECEDEEVTELKNILDENELLRFLIQCIDDWRWNSRNGMRIRNIIMLLAKSINFQIGGFSHRQKAKEFICQRLDIKNDEDQKELTASPIDFHVFREEILMRYPSYVPPPSRLPGDFENPSSLSQFITIPRTQQALKQITNYDTPPLEIHIATPVPSPSPPSSPSNRTTKAKRFFRAHDGYPFIFPVQNEKEVIPKSVKEASELFATRVREKLSLKQLWSERNLFVQQERGWVEPIDPQIDEFDYCQWDADVHGKELNSLKRVEALYKGSLSHLSSLVHVLVQIIVSSRGSLTELLNISGLDGSERSILRTKEVLVKNATHILHLLLRWFKTTHVLKFEYLSSLIYDANFFTIVMQYLNTIDTNLLNRINLRAVYDQEVSFWADNPEQGKIDENFCFSLVNLLEITAMICQRKTQRILSISELNPAPVLKNILALQNGYFWSPALKIVKQITSFNGKKWKANNMDLISMVYLYSKLDLKDNWLSGRDINGEIADAYGQEIALRALVQFYNSRKYITTMNEMGYEKKVGDFFTREIDLISNDL